MLPAGLEEFVEYVVPVLQRRGLFRTEYTGTTLRDHYGLPRPGNQFAPDVEEQHPWSTTAPSAVPASSSAR